MTFWVQSLCSLVNWSLFPRFASLISGFQFTIYNNWINCSSLFSIIRIAAMCIYPVQPVPLAHTCLYYYLLSPQYTVLYILLYCTFYSLFLFFYLYLYIFSCVVLRILHCPLSGPDLIYISLLIISRIIEYVTNKRTLNLFLRLHSCLVPIHWVLFILCMWKCSYFQY